MVLAAELPPAKSRALVDGLGSTLLTARESILHAQGLSPSERKRLETVSIPALETAKNNGAFIWHESQFSETLAAVSDYVPPALFVHGVVECLSKPTVGIVGTRNASPYGKACAHKFAEALAAQGVTVVSGGALGIDAAAHRGALAAGGSTTAVLAGGIDHVYPAIHHTLFKEIRRNGCLVSQFAAGSRPNDYKFLARNVTVAALSQVLLVVQAPVRSGALSTAHAMADLGREVMVVPANIDSHDFRGSFNLLRDGATLVYHPSQVLEALGMESRARSKAVVEESALISALGMEPTPVEKIVDGTGLSMSDVLAELTMLDLEGRVVREAGGYLLRS